MYVAPVSGCSHATGCRLTLVSRRQPLVLPSASANLRLARC